MKDRPGPMRFSSSEVEGYAIHPLVAFSNRRAMRTEGPIIPRNLTTHLLEYPDTVEIFALFDAWV